MAKDPKGFRPRGGKITDRLRKVFGDTSAAWWPGREAKPEVPKESIKKSSGWSLGGGSNRARTHGRGADKKKK